MVEVDDSGQKLAVGCGQWLLGVNFFLNRFFCFAGKGISPGKVGFQFLHGGLEVHLIKELDELDDIAALAAAKALPEILTGGD